MRKPRTRAVSAPTANPDNSLGVEISSPSNPSQESLGESSTQDGQACSTSEKPAYEITIQPIADEYKFVIITIRDRSQVESRWMVPMNVRFPLKNWNPLSVITSTPEEAETRRN